uniref:Uncharacterized protein n=1 Tax=Mola mola TaxID=94237 RepID=A0A3Q3WW44_MOLML
MLSEGNYTDTHTMLAIIEECEVESDCQTDNTEKYVMLMLFKLGLDAGAFYLCCQKLYDSIFSMCSLSIVLADLGLTFSLVAVWLLGADGSHATLCFLLTNASAVYGTLPLPMIFLGLLDCYLHTYPCGDSAYCKYLRNAVLVLLAWMLAVIYSISSVEVELTELDYMTWMKVVVCKVEESRLIAYFSLVLFIATTCAMLPFLSSIPQWLKESISPQPPLWFSLTLGFGMFWMPYLIISVTCLLLNFGAPSYIAFNVLWLECTNCLLMGLLFWTKSNKQGTYCSLPKNMCLWHMYWKLSKGKGQHQFPIAVLDPSKTKRNTLHDL